MSLVLEGLTVRFGGRAAVDNLHLEVPNGACTGFLGHNGAGKTTAMRAALGLVAPRAGRVLVDGFDAALEPREARARVGALIETCRFQESLGGLENLVELARLGGLARKAARLEATRRLEQVGLADAAKKPVRAYSQGMRQRLGIAQALLGGPSTLLLDEPTNGLDPEGIAEVRELVRALAHRDGCAVLLSSHLLGEVAEACDRIAVLRQGRLVAAGDTAELLRAGPRRYHVEVRDRARARTALGSLGLVLSEGADGTPAQEAAADRVTSRFECDLGEVEPDRLARALVETDAGLIAMRPAARGLEALYLASSHGQLAPPEPPAPRGHAAPAERRAPARPLIHLFGYELRRLVRAGAAFWLLAPAAIGALAIARRLAEARARSEEVLGGELASATEMTAFEALGRGWLAGLPLLAPMAAGLASQLIAAERARGTLRNVLLRPIGRLRVGLGKALVALLWTLYGHAALVLATWGLALHFLEFSDVTELLPNGERFPIVPASELWPELQSALAGSLLPLAAFALLGLAVGSLARTAAGALAGALGLVVLLDLLRGFAREVGLESWLPGAYLPSVLGDASQTRAFAYLAEGVTNVRFEHAWGALIVPLAWAAGALAVSLFALRRRDVP